MKKLLVLTIVLLSVLSVHAAEIKIGYVDLNRALNESQEGEKAVKVLEEMVKGKQVQINQKGDEIKKLDEEIAKQSSILNPESIKEKQEQRDKYMRDYQRMIKDSQDEVEKQRAKFMESIIKDLRDVVIAIGKGASYSAIFEKAESGLLYIPKESDITDKVIEKFNKTSKADTGK